MRLWRIPLQVLGEVVDGFGAAGADTEVRFWKVPVQ